MDHDSNLIMFIGLVQLIDSASTSASISMALALALGAQAVKNPLSKAATS